MTPDELGEILARAERASPGPWSRLGIRQIFKDAGLEKEIDFEEDAKFVAHARTDIPRLAAALKEAWEERDRLREALEDARETIHSDFCGTGRHHPLCVGPSEALKEREK